MHIQISTDDDIGGSEALRAHVTAAVEKSLNHLDAHLTRVEVHLRDENGAKAGADDKRCMMEARPRNLQPVAVSHQADNVHQAVDGAARKLTSALERLFGKLENRPRRPDIEDEEVDMP